MRGTGVADLPLHHGKAPRWLFGRMVKLARALSDVIVLEWGQEELLRRLSDPFWFQGLSCALGFDWHSSGTTTTVCGALKLALSPEEHGVLVAGGKGKASKKAPEEIASAPFGFSDSERRELIYSSRMSAKVDSALVQDGYQLYHHSFFFTERGKWCVVQQGMGGSYARRYHWLSEGVKSYIEEPHSAICCNRIESSVLDLTAKESEETRKTSLDLVRDNPEHLRKYIGGQTRLTGAELSLPVHEEIRQGDISKQGWEMLKRAYELQPASYEELVAIRGMGPKTLRALALLSDLLYGSKPSWKDPVKYAFAHGGKDGYPFPVDRETYDESIGFLQDAVKAARIGQDERQQALRRLSALVLP